jgi:hypothetical protein
LPGGATTKTFVFAFIGARVPLLALAVHALAASGARRMRIEFLLVAQGAGPAVAIR